MTVRIIRPAEDRRMRHAHSTRVLGDDGEAVTWSSYWQRALQAGDIEVARFPEVADGSEPGEPTWWSWEALQKEEADAEAARQKAAQAEAGAAAEKPAAPADKPRLVAPPAPPATPAKPGADASDKES